MNQPPAFQFYASDYLSSSKVQLMSLDERGAYVQLLCYNWQDGSIPSDIGKLAKLCGTNPKTMARIWESLVSCFVANDEPGRLVNSRLEEVRLEQKRFREKKSEAGRLGGFHSGESRREAKGSTASVLLEADAKQTPKQNEALQSPSPVSNKKEKPSLRSGKKKCPDGLPVTDEHREWAAVNHITVDLIAETDAMIDWAHGKAETRADWEATRRNWWRNAQKRNGGNGNGNHPKSRQDITRENAESLIRDIENQRGLQRRPEQRDAGHLPE